MAFLKLYT